MAASASSLCPAQVGQKLDARDSLGKWLPATIVDLEDRGEPPPPPPARARSRSPWSGAWECDATGSWQPRGGLTLLINFDGFEAKWDEWVHSACFLHDRAAHLDPALRPRLGPSRLFSSIPPTSAGRVPRPSHRFVKDSLVEVLVFIPAAEDDDGRASASHQPSFRRQWMPAVVLNVDQEQIHIRYQPPVSSNSFRYPVWFHTQLGEVKRFGQIGDPVSAITPPTPINRLVSPTTAAAARRQREENGIPNGFTNGTTNGYPASTLMKPHATPSTTPYPRAHPLTLSPSPFTAPRVTVPSTPSSPAVPPSSLSSLGSGFFSSLTSSLSLLSSDPYALGRMCDVRSIEDGLWSEATVVQVDPVPSGAPAGTRSSITVKLTNRATTQLVDPIDQDHMLAPHTKYSEGTLPGKFELGDIVEVTLHSSSQYMMRGAIRQFKQGQMRVWIDDKNDGYWVNPLCDKVEWLSRPPRSQQNGVHHHTAPTTPSTRTPVPVRASAPVTPVTKQLVPPHAAITIPVPHRTTSEPSPAPAPVPAYVPAYPSYVPAPAPAPAPTPKRVPVAAPVPVPVAAPVVAAVREANSTSSPSPSPSSSASRFFSFNYNKPAASSSPTIAPAAPLTAAPFIHSSLMSSSSPAAVAASPAPSNSSPAFYASLVRRAYSSAPPRTAVGMVNMGNSCYISAGLQCLAGLAPLIQYFVVERAHENVLAERRLRNKVVARSPHAHTLSPTSRAGGLLQADFGQLTSEFASLLAQLHSGSRGPRIWPDVLKRRVVALENDAGARFAGMHMQDAHEFLAVLLNALHTELNLGVAVDHAEEAKTNANEEPLVPALAARRHWTQFLAQHTDPISHLFYCQSAQYVVCSACRHHSISHHVIGQLTLDIPQDPAAVAAASASASRFLGAYRSPIKSPKSSRSVTLTECLSTQLAVADLDDYLCSRCKAKHAAHSAMYFTSLPPVLLIQLKRFDTVMGASASSIAKDETPCEYPRTLDVKHLLKPHPDILSRLAAGVTPYIADSSSTCTRYRLSGVVLHSDQHFTALTRVRADDDRSSSRSGSRDTTPASAWCYFNDSKFTIEDEVDVLAQTKDVYLLMYERADA